MLNELERQIKETIKRSGHEICHKDMLTLLKTIGQKDFMCDLLMHIASNGPLCSQIAKSSYSHYNGFDKVLLLKSGSDFELRLHVWLPNRTNSSIEVDNNIHNHRWDFCTYLLVGSYNFEIYDYASYEQQVANVSSYHHYKYLPPLGAPNYIMEYIGETRLQKLETGNVSATNGYYLDKDVKHKINNVLNEPLVTLFLCGPPSKSSTDVFSNGTILNPENVNAEPLDSTYIINKFQILSKLLS